jgi:hypothetical protein
MIIALFECSGHSIIQDAVIAARIDPADDFLDAGGRNCKIVRLDLVATAESAPQEAIGVKDTAPLNALCDVFTHTAGSVLEAVDHAAWDENDWHVLALQDAASPLCYHGLI